MPLGLGHRLHEKVFARGEREVVAFCLVSHVETNDKTVLLVRDVLELAADGYLDTSSHGAAWRGTAMLPIIDKAIREGLGIILVHAHDFPGPARLSQDDLTSARRLVPMFQARVPGRPHGSIVLARGTAAGFVVLPGGMATTNHDVSVRWTGKATMTWPTGDFDAAHDDEVFDRQALVVGHQGLLSRARVAVVGLCGGGSHVVQQFAHSGVGTIIGIDPDTCDTTNLHRDVGMRPADGRQRRPKIDVMSRMVRSIGTGSTFVGINARVPEAKTIEALRSADVIVGCVDNLHARADILEIAWRSLVPYIDIGVSIRPLKAPLRSPRATIGGNVFVFIPGGFCAWCCGFITDEKLVAERDGRDDRSYFQNKQGEAQVISFNGLVASQGVTETVQLLTGFRGSSFDPADLALDNEGQRGAFKLDGLRGTLVDWGAVRRPDCPVCNGILGAGSVLWRHAA